MSQYELRFDLKINADHRFFFYFYILCPSLLETAVGHIVFQHVTSVCGLTNGKVYIKIDIHIYFCFSLGHNLVTFYARKLKFGVLLTQT